MSKRYYIFFAFILLFIIGMRIYASNMFVELTEKDEPTIQIVDSKGRQVVIPYPLTNVAVMNPYTAELITAVGAADAIRGVDQDIYENREAFPIPITKDMVICGHGEAQIHFEKIIRLRPQVLFMDAGKDIERVEKVLGMFGIPVIVLKADSAPYFSSNCRLLGKIFQKEERAAELDAYFTHWERYVKERLENVPQKRVYYECRYFARAVVPGEFFHEMLKPAHAENIFSDALSIYVSPEYILLRRPEYIVRLSDLKDPYSCNPPSQARFEEIAETMCGYPCWAHMDAVEKNRMFLFSYYSHGGAGKLVGAMFLAKYLYPEYLPDLVPEEILRVWMEKYQGIPYRSGHTFTPEDLR